MADTDFDHLFTTAKTIAVVGLSDNPERPSFEVAQVMQQAGFRIIPVNPRLVGQRILGEPCVATLGAVTEPVDIVDCFRRSEEMADIATAAALLMPRPQVLWMQLGVVNADAARIAHDAGMAVVQDRCIKIEYRRWKAARG